MPYDPNPFTSVEMGRLLAVLEEKNALLKGSKTSQEAVESGHESMDNVSSPPAPIFKVYNREEAYI